MAHVKNVGGGLGDEDPRRPPRLPADPKGKATRKLATKKHKYLDAETARATAVVEATDRAERGGTRSGVVIVDQLSQSTRAALEQVERRHGGLAGTVMIEGWRVAIDESQSQGESQQQPQPAEQTQEGEQAKETKQAPQPQLCHSGCTHALVTPRSETWQRGSRPPPRPQGPPPVTHLDLRVAMAKQVQLLRFVDFER